MTPASALTVAGTPPSSASKSQTPVQFPSSTLRRPPDYAGQPVTSTGAPSVATTSSTLHHSDANSTPVTSGGNGTIPTHTSSPVTGNGVSATSTGTPQADEMCYLKLLVPNIVAGSIIGPKGATVSHISSSTGCTVKLSHSTCYFPGTTDRVIVLSGKLRDLCAAFSMILEKIRDGPSVDGSGIPITNSLGQPIRLASVQDTAAPRTVVKIVVPNSAVSQLIGKQGRAIKELQDTTRTKIQISNRDEHQFKERVVTISGAFDTVSQAAVHVLESIQSDPHIRDHTQINYVTSTAPLDAMRSNFGCLYPGMSLVGQNQPGLPTVLPTHMRNGRRTPFGARQLGSNGDPVPIMAVQQVGNNSSTSPKFFIPFYDSVGATPAAAPGTIGAVGMHSNHHSSSFHSPYSPKEASNGLYAAATSTAAGGPLMEYTLEVPDSCVGFLIGKQGTALQAIQQQAGVRIKISDKGDFVPGTANRRLMITGNPMAIQFAAALFQHRLHELEEIARQRGGVGNSGAREGTSHFVASAGQHLTASGITGLPLAMPLCTQGERDTADVPEATVLGPTFDSGGALNMGFLGSNNTSNRARPPGFAGCPVNSTAAPTSVFLGGPEQEGNILEYQCGPTYGSFSNFSVGH